MDTGKDFFQMLHKVCVYIYIRYIYSIYVCVMIPIYRAMYSSIYAFVAIPGYLFRSIYLSSYLYYLCLYNTSTYRTTTSPTDAGSSTKFVIMPANSEVYDHYSRRLSNKEWIDQQLKLYVSIYNGRSIESFASVKTLFLFFIF